MIIREFVQSQEPQLDAGMIANQRRLASKSVDRLLSHNQDEALDLRGLRISVVITSDGSQAFATLEVPE